ncbi:MAG: Hsp20 family protein [Alphaproteobacteria bacterium]
MVRMSSLNSPLFLGFERIEATLERVAKAQSDGYPPYNVEQTGPDALRITLAVAGFVEADLSVQIEDRQLAVRGKQVDEPGRVYLHRGIAARQFQRSFVLADGIEVIAATLSDGLLHIDLVQPSVEARVRTVEIKATRALTDEMKDSHEMKNSGHPAAKGREALKAHKGIAIDAGSAKVGSRKTGERS